MVVQPGEWQTIAGAPDGQPFPEPLRAYAQGPHVAKHQAIQERAREAARVRGIACRLRVRGRGLVCVPARRTRLAIGVGAYDVRPSQRLRDFRGGVPAAPERHVDREAHGAGPGPRHLPRVEVDPAEKVVWRPKAIEPDGLVLQGALHHLAVHPGALVGRRQEVRHAPLCARHELSAIEGLLVPRRLLPLLRRAVFLGRRGDRQRLRAPDERGRAEASGGLQRPHGRQVGHRGPAAVHREHPRRGRQGQARRRHGGRHRALPQGRARRAHQRQALLRDVWLRHIVGRELEAMVA
mmetsp:Transcript_3487/g.10512  ORF Transcript_3487/g.10512 Transcript_3487/m.10512 type:complete len:294 (+) Transcript_3487:167-1048(+)